MSEIVEGRIRWGALALRGATEARCFKRPSLLVHLVGAVLYRTLWAPL